MNSFYVKMVPVMERTLEGFSEREGIESDFRILWMIVMKFEEMMMIKEDEAEKIERVQRELEIDK